MVICSSAKKPHGASGVPKALHFIAQHKNWDKTNISRAEIYHLKRIPTSQSVIVDTLLPSRMQAAMI
jgi:hypothetical protein